MLTVEDQDDSHGNDEVVREDGNQDDRTQDVRDCCGAHSERVGELSK